MANPNPKLPSKESRKGNGAKGIPWTKALQRALKQRKFNDNSEANALRRIADQVVDCALDKNNEHFEFAIKEIGARVDGHPGRGEAGPTAAEFLHSISDAVTALNDFASKGQTIDGEIIVPDRPVLSAEVCVEAGGHGEGVDIPAVSGSSEQS